MREGESSDGTLIGRFDAWLGSPKRPLPADFPSRMLISVDANVLLTLYELSASSRGQVLSALNAVKDRIWITNQVAQEFARNRQRVVADRESRFTAAKNQFRSAPQKAAQELYRAIENVNELRKKNQSGRAWDEKTLGLDRASLERYLSDALAEATKEFDELRGEHDVTVRDVQSRDALLVEISELIGEQIGPEPSDTELRRLVEEAHNYRFPNDIPPGHADEDKPTALLSAGDYILWHQLLSRAKFSTDTRVVLVTNETKVDWWQLGKEGGRPLGPQPQLVHEMRTVAQSEFFLVSLPSFLEATRSAFPIELSESTVREVSEVEPYNERVFFWDAGALLGYSIRAFERAVEEVLLNFGYQILERGVDAQDRGFDLIVAQPGQLEETRTLVEIKRYTRPVPAEVVRSVLGAMRIHRCDYGLIVTSSRLSPSARLIANENNIGVIEGKLLRQKLQELQIDPDNDGEEP